MREWVYLMTASIINLLERVHSVRNRSEKLCNPLLENFYPSWMSWEVGFASFLYSDLSNKVHTYSFGWLIMVELEPYFAPARLVSLVQYDMEDRLALNTWWPWLKKMKRSPFWETEIYFLALMLPMHSTKSEQPVFQIAPQTINESPPYLTVTTRGQRLASTSSPWYQYCTLVLSLKPKADAVLEASFLGCSWQTAEQLEMPIWGFRSPRR